MNGSSKPQNRSNRLRAAVAALVLIATTMGGTRLGGGAAAGQIATDQPNILVFVTDDQRIGSMGVMPETNHYFADQGTTFRRAFATTPLCCPSRGSIFTGRYMHNHGVAANADDAIENLDQSTTLQRYLEEAGYTTAIFGKYFNPWPLDVDPPHFDKWAIDNWSYYNVKFNVQGDVKKVPGYSTDFISDKANRFLKSRTRTDSPWFLYVAPTAPHAPFMPEKDYKNAPVPRWHGDPAVAENNRSDKPGVVQQWDVTRGQARYIRKRQLRTLMSVDDMVGRLMKTLEATGEADNTIAVFMSDNGYLWGEHGLRDKRFPYLPSVRIPMFMRWPGVVPAGDVDTRMAANIDIAPTMFDATGITPEHDIDGRSLLDDWDRDRLLLEYAKDLPPLDVVPQWAGVLTDEYEYVEYYDGAGVRVFREYYDLVQDPYQLVNLLRDDDPNNDPSPATLEMLSSRVFVDRHCAGADCP